MRGGSDGRQRVSVGDYLTLIGELAIGVTGFSGVVAALSRRSADGWRPVDVLRLQALLRISIGVAMWAVVPALLLSSGLTGPLLWRVVSGSWLLLTALSIYSLVRPARTLLSDNREDVSRGFSVFVISGLLAAFALQGANVVVVAAPWPHMTALAWGLLTSLALFLGLATVALASTRSAA